MAEPTSVAHSRYRLRDETAADEAFLRALYVAIRWEETARMGMSDDALRVTFLQQQFDMQRHHYRGAYHDAQFSVIIADGVPIGRLYLWRGVREHIIVDISLLPGVSGQGIGSAIIDDVLADAAAVGCGVSIHVENFNPARRLYYRKGFRPIEQVGPYWKMEWMPVHAAVPLESLG